MISGSESANPKKRARSPPYPPFVKDYRPYTSGQLRRLTTERNKDNHKQHWDLYYRNNTINGYKDRHYILREFTELRTAIEAASRERPVAPASSFSWMEAGCGVGNAMLPIFEEHGALPQWRSLLGFDISAVAVTLLKEKVAAMPPVLAEKVHVCALNPCERDVVECPLFEMGAAPSSSSSSSSSSPAQWVPRSPLNRVEFVSMVFVLCSIPVAKHAIVLRRIAACMAEPGGVFFFRDYCVSDHAEERFRKRDQESGKTNDMEAEADPNTYARTNGTISHFFSEEEVRTLFESAGFAVIELKEVGREVMNRKTETVLSRKFIQGRFRLEKLAPLQLQQAVPL